MEHEPAPRPRTIQVGTNFWTVAELQDKAADASASNGQLQISYGYRFWRALPPGDQFTNPGELGDPRLYPLMFRIKPGTAPQHWPPPTRYMITNYNGPAMIINLPELDGESSATPSAAMNINRAGKQQKASWKSQRKFGDLYTKLP